MTKHDDTSGAWPVSYTHLDVYKRQTQHNGDQHLDGSVDVALTGIAADGTAVEGKHGRHGIDRCGLDASDSGLGGMGDLLDELLHEIFLL